MRASSHYCSLLALHVPSAFFLWSPPSPARRRASAMTYIAGSLWTSIGTDLLNRSKLQERGVPVASIGGAGTFDGIFLTGIPAVLLA